MLKLLRDGGNLILVGVSDRSVRRRHWLPGLDATLEGPPGRPDHAAKSPASEARRAAAFGAAWLCSRGGLIAGIDRFAARANAGYLSGAYAVDGMTLYVNNGTALWAGLAVRLGHPSELTWIALHRAHTT